MASFGGDRLGGSLIMTNIVKIHIQGHTCVSMALVEANVALQSYSTYSDTGSNCQPSTIIAEVF